MKKITPYQGKLLSFLFVILWTLPLTASIMGKKLSCNYDDKSPYELPPSYCESYGNGAGYGIGAISFSNIYWNTSDPFTGYQDFTSVVADVEIGSTYQLSTYVRAPYSLYVYVRVWIDWNQDGDFNDSNEEYYLGRRNYSWWDLTTNAPMDITIPSGALTGNTTMRVSAKRNDHNFGPCETGITGTVEDYTINVIDPNAEPEINVSGNNNNIANGDSTPSFTDGTDYGPANIGQNVTNTFTIENLGDANLTISNISLSNTTDFSISGTPYSSPVLVNSSTDVSITMNSSTTGAKNCTVTITNNDSDESSYQFSISALVIQDFYDSDGDGIYDNVDVDDDNDGILDSIEENHCKNSPISTTTNYKFLNETFGTGTGRSTINSYNYNVSTTYCFEDGIVGTNTTECPSQSSWVLDDGEYCVVSKITGTEASDPENIHGDLAWYNGQDHTEGDTNGKMAVFNASYTPGVFYETTVTGVLPNTPISYEFWALNIMAQSTFPGSILPDITLQFLDLDENIITSYNTGPFGRCLSSTTDNSCSQGQWHQFSTDVNLGNVNSFIVRFINNAPGGGGNDLALDDIIISQTLCDTDGDGVADVFDLDSDNDGIPDVVEAGLGSISGGKATLTNAIGWLDLNGNGMHDLAESNTPLDSDGDGTPNYLDLDSDNDAIFDVDESGAGNLADLLFENGDGDIDGDGVGDGPDTDAVRETDIDSDGTVEYFADGILDAYDYFNGAIFNDAYGNVNQGLSYLLFVLDTDLDGIPNYIDVDSNNDGIMDIAGTLYSNLDADNDGIIDDTSDYDKDGLLDLFDTNDSYFGSPRDLDLKLDLYMDGRNDYADDSPILGGLTNASIMAWVKIDPTFVGNAIILGQSSFELELINNGGDFIINAHGNNKNVQSDPIPAAQWVHIAATYNNSPNRLTLYINGENVGSTNGVGSSIGNNTFNFTIGKSADPGDLSGYFKGFIDEIRVFDKTLSDNEIQKMVYQEIGNNSGNVRGTIIPKDITDFVDNSNINPLLWSNLQRYYRMDTFKGDIIDDLTTPSVDLLSGCKIYNVKLIDYQTAPMPFVSQSGDGYLPDVLDIPSSGVNGYDAVTYDWSIVDINHNNVTYDSQQKHLGLFVDSADDDSNPIEYHVTNDSEINVSWYLKLDGFIDLEGESQLVQGPESTLDVDSAGRIEKDQQGTQDLFTYNYWSSPVSLVNSTNNNTVYTVPNVLRDGSNPSSPQNINFIGGYNGNSGSPISIAHYWIWKYANMPSDDYASWQHIRNTGSLNPGEGFTMKGVSDTSGDVSEEQNYVFEGKPNNGDITLTLNAGNDYLIGNPYPSAIDADQFITDNGPNIQGNGNLTGTLYFWEHWGGGSHYTSDYQGGYATYNLSGGVPSASMGTNDPDIATGGVPTKLPGRYIPVGQGFFVIGENSGDIKFNNGQRIFQVEDGINSVFVREQSSSATTSETGEALDTRLKLRLGFNSVNTLRRQILVTQDQRATEAIDWGFDGKLNEDQQDDMFWMIDADKFTIQGTDLIDESTVLPIGIKVATQGINSITIDELINAPEELDVFLHDLSTGIYHDLKESDFLVTLEAGEYLNRFEITFSSESLSTDDVSLNTSNTLQVIYAANSNHIVLKNPELVEIKSMDVYNMLGQSIYHEAITESSIVYRIQPRNMSSGTYIVQVRTKDKGTINKKVLIK